MRFFAVGLAWGAPFVALAFVNTNPGAAVYPALARLFGPVQWPLLGAAPFLAVVGIVVTACLVSPGRGVLAGLGFCGRYSCWRRSPPISS